jgi:hypothetical protein
MRTHPWLRLLLTAAWALAWAGAAAAQGKPAKASHHSLDDAPPPLNGPEEALARRLGGATDLRMDLEFLERYLKLDDPAARQKMEEKLKKLLEKRRDLIAGIPGLKDGKFPENVEDQNKALKQLENIAKEVAKQPSGVPNGTTDSKNGNETTQGTKPNPSDPHVEKPVLPSKDEVETEEEWFKKVFDKLGGALDDLTDGDASDLLQDILKSLGRHLPDGMDLNGPFGRLREALPEVGGHFPSIDLPDLKPFWNGITPPSLPSLPNINLPSFPSGPSFGGSWSGGGGGGGGAAWSWLFWLAAAVVVGVLVWKAIAVGAPTAAEAEWALGPWPVDPRRVATRGELVVAFEYLALKLLGLEARHHHHVDLEARLAARPSSSPARQRVAAARLSRLYEHAKYAPPEELLSDAELADARGDLCHLAGATAA